MTAPRPPESQHALQAAVEAMRRGDRRTARRHAERAAALDPSREEAWLVLAALAHPRASVAYLQKALEINPNSDRARRGMRWALERVRASRKPTGPRQPLAPVAHTPESLVRSQPLWTPWLLALALVAASVAFWFWSPLLTDAFARGRRGAPAQVAQYKPTYTPTPTFTPTPTATNTPTPTATPTITPTPPPPTPTPLPPYVPEGVGPDEPWVNVDLGAQRAHAYRGAERIRSFTVSTGTWQHPTVTGQYAIYVKYRFADMSGPGYYLPDVPYVMYFYRGYGLHGTYWHNNFGTPMSHGCVNFTIDDAGWLFDFASVGTVVYVHN